MQATLYALSKPIGVLRGSPAVADPPDDPTLQGVLASPLRDMSGATLTAEDGERWLRELPRQYRSPYLWVGLDEDAEPAEDFSEAVRRFDESFESKHPRDKGKFAAKNAVHTSAAAQKLRPAGKLQGDARTKDYGRQAAHHHRRHRIADDIDKAVQEGSHERLHAALRDAVHQGYMTPEEAGAAWPREEPEAAPATPPPASRHPLDPASPSQGDAPYDPSIAFRPTPEESAAMRADDWRTRTPGTKEYAAAQAAKATPPTPAAAPAKAAAVPDVELPELRGTAGQVAYATKVRDKHLSEAKALAEKAISELDPTKAAQVAQAYRSLAARQRASDWLDYKNTNGGDLLRQAWKRMWAGFSEKPPFPEPRRR